MKPVFRFLLVCAALASANCSTCAPTPVPFQSQADQPPTAEPTTPNQARSAFVPVEATALPDATPNFALEGAPVSVPGHTIRAVLPLDLDHDGDRDAIVVALDAQLDAKLMIAMRDASAFRPATLLSALSPLTPGCAATRYALRLFAPSFVLASFDQTCPEGITAAPVPSLVVSVASPPSVRERFTLLASLTSPADRAQMSFRAEDKDGDGNDDLLVDLMVSPEGLADEAPLSLTYFDRPSGLARDTHEPEATLLRLMARTRERARRRDTAFALETAKRVLAFHNVICRESGVSRLRVGDSIGVMCGPSAAAGSAIAILVRELVRTHDLTGALAASERASQAGYTLTRADRTVVETAMNGITSEVPVRLITGPNRSAPNETQARLSPLAFSEDGQSILMRGPSPLRYDLASQAVTPGEMDDEDTRIYDVSHAFSIRDVHRTCDGYVLGIVRGDGIVANGSYDALILPTPPPAGASCPLSPSVSRDAGGFTVLGWAPQGAVVARGDTLYVVPIGENGTALGPASVLPQGSPAPAPLTPGATTRDGHAYVVATSIGFFIHILAPQPRTLFVRPSEWSTLAGDLAGVALSDDTMHVAFLKGGRLYVLSRETAPDTH